MEATHETGQEKIQRETGPLYFLTKEGVVHVSCTGDRKILFIFRRQGGIRHLEVGKGGKLTLFGCYDIGNIDDSALVTELKQPQLDSQMGGYLHKDRVWAAGAVHPHPDRLSLHDVLPSEAEIISGLHIIQFHFKSWNISHIFSFFMSYRSSCQFPRQRLHRSRIRHTVNWCHNSAGS